MKKFAILLAIAVTLTLVACGEDEENTPAVTETPISDQGGQEGNNSEEQAQNITTVLTVRGMVCGRCVNDVNAALAPLNGIISVSVDMNADRVTVVHEPELSVDEIRNAIILEAMLDVD